MRFVATVQSGNSKFVSRITDLSVIDLGGRKVLFSATYAGGGIASFNIGDADLAATPLAQWKYSSAFRHEGDPELVFLSEGGHTSLTLTGLANAGRYVLPVLPDGRLGSLGRLFSDDPLPADLSQLGQIEIGGNSYVYAARQEEVEFNLYRQLEGGRLVRTDRSYLPGAAVMKSASIDKMIDVRMGNETVLIAASGQGNFLSSQRVDALGRIVRADYIDVKYGSGFNVPTDMAAVTVGGHVFLILASAQSSSLTTMRLAPDGSLIPVDHVVDELTTRFQRVTALATLEYEGRAYVFVGGADDGITMFTVLPDGRLLHLETVVDNNAMSLADVSAIEADIIGGEIVLFVASASERGITQLSVDPGRAGRLLRSATAGQIAGTSRNDMLRAGHDTTHMRGDDGDDILITRSESIQLWGGAGRDTFVATAVHGRILIWDYDPAEDRLDLSQLGMIRSTYQLRFEAISGGMRIRFGDTLIDIRSADGGPLPASLFTNEMFPVAHYSSPDLGTIIVGSGSRDILHAARAGSEIYGRDGNDILLGSSVEDTLSGGGGHDTISGGNGEDSLRGGAGNDRMRGGGGNDTISGEDGSDILIGDGGNDELRGGGGSDSLFGGSGADSLYGASGHDYLAGGDGDDILSGAEGNDSMSGGTGADRLEDVAGNNNLAGGAGNDTLIAGDGVDRLSGSSGADSLQAGGGDDRLSGGAGQDYLDAGAGCDSIRAGAGDDQALGRAGSDTIYGGAGNDSVQGDEGNDLIRAGQGDDTISGGAGDDTLIGTTGQNELSGDADNDMIWGGALNDRLNGGDGADTLFGQGGADVLDGGADGDMLLGGGGNDLLRGDDGNDLLKGGAGSDRLLGGAGDDYLIGADDDDVLIGGAGQDVLSGGAGADVFLFHLITDSTAAEIDRIADFEAGLDQIDLSAFDLEFVGERAAASVRQLRVEIASDHQLLLADLDGDGEDDLVIRIDGLTALSEGDFLL